MKDLTALFWTLFAVYTTGEALDKLLNHRRIMAQAQNREEREQEMLEHLRALRAHVEG